VRPFRPEDYEAVAAVSNAVFPEYAQTAEDWRHEDEHDDPKCLRGRVVAEHEGAVVGVAGFNQWANRFHPRKFGVYASLLPEHRGRGLGEALHQAVLAALAPHQPISLTAEAREDMTEAVRFLVKHGYEEKMRSWESRLALPTFDPEPFRAGAQRAYDGGIVIRTLPELAADPARDRKMYDLAWELQLDVPATEPPTPIDFEYYVRERLNHPDFIQEGCFVALDGEDFVGYTNFWRTSTGPELYTGLTGVRRAYRRRGIALALKLRALEWAKASGAPQVKTWNEQNNRGMLSINEALGFVKQPAWVVYVKTLAESE
jgi:GNAT superfamily N-acetyltransferase